MCAALDSRYSRQILFEKIGVDGQRRIRESHVVLIGCGALGTAIANTLTRAGVGRLRICDRDFVERDNLQRQILFDEDDAKASLPKAVAARNKLVRINSEVEIDAIVSDVNHTNIAEPCTGTDLILDGTDNFETRFLINDYAVSSNRPWIYGAVVEATGTCMTILPGTTPCLRCVFDEPPPPGTSPTCDTAGVIEPVVQIVAGLQTIEALKILSGREREINRGLVQFEGWNMRLTRVNVETARSSSCPCCGERTFPFLEGQLGNRATVLCGRNAVQVRPSSRNHTDLTAVAERLSPMAKDVRVNKHLLCAELGDLELALFHDGRAIIKGTSNIDQARSAYAKYVGG